MVRQPVNNRKRESHLLGIAISNRKPKSHAYIKIRANIMAKILITGKKNLTDRRSENETTLPRFDAAGKFIKRRLNKRREIQSDC